jgi:hypothetical protein
MAFREYFPMVMYTANANQRVHRSKKRLFLLWVRGFNTLKVPNAEE